ncbi:FGGY-family carbohydrate kinase [Geofilum rubicundum]|uniref:FGGY-family carbohydrate kinase n=1 Tax=Geofilum rubicundum TaxID=472113 RepID=UPI000785BE70|nr:FGGY-family carbohydrate kinase [Geofilum rubicundum]
MRESLEILQSAGGFNTDRIICVGGGSKNRIWNQIRADVCQVPVQLIQQNETTVLGAALFVFSGAGVFKNPEAARTNIDYSPILIEPNKDSASFYQEQYRKFLELKKRN